MKSNITMIGMPSSGKSTIGVLLAKTLGFDFLDTDLLIQTRENALLQDILDAHGTEDFLELEADAICSVECAERISSIDGLTADGSRPL